MQEAEAANQPPPYYSSLEDMAFTIMDFLFASQVGQALWLRMPCQDSSNVAKCIQSSK